MDWLYPGRECQYSTQHSPNPSHKSKKPQKLLSTVKGFVHRGRSSFHALPASKSTNELTIKHPHWPPRSRSMNSTDQPTPWKQRGQTPGMDDYLTLAELESVWINQDSYVGGIEAPERAASYQYVEPVEAPTSVKHQILPESTRPTLPQLQIPRSYAPSPRQIEEGDDAVRRVIDDLARRPHSDPVSEVSSPGPDILDTSSEQASPSVTQIRNAVVSGIVHPALRPTPYFDSNNAKPNCGLTSRFAITVPSSNWTYGKV